MFSPGQTLSDKFRLERLLGLGGFAEVWLATDLEARDEVAVKIFLRQDDDGIRLCQEEYLRSKGMKHPNILRPFFFSHLGGAPFIVMPYCAGGPVLRLTRKMSETGLARLIAQIGGALDYIHNLSAPIIHNDIKPDNLLVDDDGAYMLSDFGISERLLQKFNQSVDLDDQRTVPMDTDQYHLGETPLSYRAPELIQFKKRSKRNPSAMTDMWSFGVSLYQIITGEMPFGREGGLQEHKYFDGTSQDLAVRDIVPPLPEGFSPELEALLFGCMAYEPSQRPPAARLLESAQRFLSSGRWEQPVETAREIRVSKPRIDFGPIKKGQAAVEQFTVTAEGLSGRVHLTATPPYLLALPGQSPAASLDLTAQPHWAGQAVEVHFEPISSRQLYGEVAVSHPQAEAQTVQLSGRGKEKPVWATTAVGTAVAVVLVVGWFISRNGDKKTVGESLVPHIVAPAPHIDSSKIKPGPKPPRPPKPANVTPEPPPSLPPSKPIIDPGAILQKRESNQ